MAADQHEGGPTPAVPCHSPCWVPSSPGEEHALQGLGSSPCRPTSTRFPTGVRCQTLSQYFSKASTRL